VRFRPALSRGATPTVRGVGPLLHPAQALGDKLNEPRVLLEDLHHQHAALAEVICVIMNGSSVAGSTSMVSAGLP
jgi:hypothetical protein